MPEASLRCWPGYLVAGGAGGYIYFNTSVLNAYHTPKEEEQMQVDYEKKYRRYISMPQPRITAVSMNTDIYPKTGSVHFKGQMMLVNKHDFPLDSVIVNYNSQGSQVHLLQVGPLGAAHEVHEDSLAGLNIYKLNEKMMPGDSMPLFVDMEYTPHGFPNGSPGTSVVGNGSFFNSGMLPGLGYNEDAELEQDKDRKAYGLLPKPRMASLHDMKARQNTYISRDADWIRFETTVSTDADQTAIAPGYLQKEWEHNGRRYFTYKMDRPMLNFYAWLSARYQKYTDSWLDTAGHRSIPIEIYYQPGHEYNLKRMVAGVKEALAYCSHNFSPYQHQQVRILEFPRYASFAQSFANTIPFSESIGFIARVDDGDPEDIDYPFYVTAHEVAHQWWAHQVIGANVQGSTLMSESMAEYSALMVMRHHYGPYTMQKFLKFDLNGYLSGRSFERKKELPLALVENQQYIHYNKGSVVMYALQDYMGEEKLNAALKAYVEKVAFQGPPYTTSAEFIGYIRRAAPDSLQGMITDMFDKITLYDNRVSEAIAKKRTDGKYEVQITIKCAKYYADSAGNQHAAPFSDYLPLAVFPEKGKDYKPPAPLLLTHYRFKQGDNTLTLVVDKKPASVMIDPYYEVVDRTLDDNSKDVGE